MEYKTARIDANWKPKSTGISVDFNGKFKNLKKFIKSRELIFIKKTRSSLDSRMLSHVERNNCLPREKIFLSNYPLPSTHLSVTVASRGSPSNLLSLSSGSSSLSPYARKHKAREWAISAPFTDFRAIKADNQYICGDYRWCYSWERGSCDRGVDNRDKSLIIDLYRTIFQSICDVKRNAQPLS